MDKNKKSNFLYQVLRNLLEQCEKRELDELKTVSFDVSKRFRYYMEKYSKELEDNHLKELGNWSPKDDKVFTSDFGNDLVYLDEIKPIIIDCIEYLKSEYEINPVYILDFIRDSDLKKKCGKLFTLRNNKDTIIMQATLILECKIRNRAGLSDEYYGYGLIRKALGEKDGMLKIHSKQKVRKNFYNMVSGFCLLYRNKSHHFLIENLDWDRIISIFLFIDEILLLINKCQNYESKQSKPTKQ